MSCTDVKKNSLITKISSQLCNTNWGEKQDSQFFVLFQGFGLALCNKKALIVLHDISIYMYVDDSFQVQSTKYIQYYTKSLFALGFNFFGHALPLVLLFLMP